MLAPLVDDQQELEDEAGVEGSHAQDPANPRSVPIFTGVLEGSSGIFFRIAIKNFFFLYQNIFFVYEVLL